MTDDFEPAAPTSGRNRAWLMKNNARCLLENPGYLSLVETTPTTRGVCDDHLAMVERIAKAAVSFLLEEGVSETRL